MEASYSFFSDRRTVPIKVIPGSGKPISYVKYMNIPPIIGRLISKRVATLHELGSVYGVKDAYDMLEVVNIDDYNAALSRQE